MRVVAMLQVYNERRFIAACIEHLHQQGVGVYVIDNESTDDTLAIAERYVGKGVVGIETLERRGHFALRDQCRRQEELAQTLDADWLIHHDADEFRVSPQRGQTLAEAIAEIDAAGFNAIDFAEFTFVPTRESPDHDHPEFQQTMRWYYPYLPWAPFRLNAWKREDAPVDLTSTGGHRVQFAGLRLAPTQLYMRHYIILSIEHAAEKFVRRTYAPEELEGGWHQWRNSIELNKIKLPSENELRRYEADHLLDRANPRTQELIHPPPAASDGPMPAQGRVPPWALRRLRRLRARARQALSQRDRSSAVGPEGP